MRSLLIAALLTLIPLLTLAQQQETPPQTATLTVNANLVALDALVRDPAGNLLLDLTPSDFALRVDNHPVPIRYFNRDNDLPLTVGLLIDTSGSQQPYFDDESLAGAIFLRNTLTHPADRAFIVRFDSQVLLLQKMTSSLSALNNGLRLLDYSPDPLRGTRRGGTLLFDAIVHVSHDVIGNEPGRRSLVILTDGDDNGSHYDQASAIHQAQLAGVAVYSILYTHEDPAYTHLPSVRPSGINVMQQISTATGGRSFIVGRGQSIAQIFAAIEQDLRSQYRLGFTPPPSAPGKYHTLQLSTPDKHLTLQTRAGYYTPDPTSPPNLK